MSLVRQCRTLAPLFLTIFFLAASAAEAEEPTKLLVRPGASIVLDSAACVTPVVPAAGGNVEIARVPDGRSYAIYRSPTDQSTDVSLTLELGTKEKADKSGCEGGKQRQFTVGIDRTPQASDQSLKKAFTILLSAFVLAVLLESAFSLLFNWRLFLEFLVGKAWRTPIMFAGALVVVRLFDLDLMASLFDAYATRTDAVTSNGNWFTAVLTAMILAGGSAGVNRIFIALGFRSQIRADLAEPHLNDAEAWIAIRVQGKKNTGKFEVTVDEVVPDPAALPPATVGFIRDRSLGVRLKDLLFPSRSRVPPSGGRKVDTNKCYRIAVVDLDNGRMYDGLSNPISKSSDGTVLRFGSRAVLDFDITVT